MPECGLSRQAVQVEELTDAVAGRDRFLELGRHFAGIPEPERRPLQGGLFLAERYRLFLEDSADVGQKLLPYLPLARRARPNGSNGPLDDDLQLSQVGLVHAGAPRIPPSTRTNCCHSARPAAS